MNSRIFVSLALLISVFMVNGCTLARHVYARLTFDFEISEIDPKIYYEKGSEEVAQEVARQISQAVFRAEKFHDLKLNGQFKIYIFTSMKNYYWYSTNRRGSASAATESLFVSPKLGAKLDRTQAILTHEFSHLLLKQHMGGALRFVRVLPVWFQEGIATLASQGGGASKVSIQDAIHAIQKGNSLLPEDSGCLFCSQGHSKHGLKAHMFYRQSSLFIKYIMEKNPQSFAQFIGDLKTYNFSEGFQKNYSKSVHQMWEEYTTHVKSNPSPDCVKTREASKKKKFFPTE